jgi:hypothetical protein
MPDISAILGAEHEIYTTNRDAWERDERRFYGRDAVLGGIGTTEVELEKFTNEKDLSYKARKAQATYLNFPLIHAKILAGHLARVAPMPNYGTLGDVRERSDIGSNNETVAEAFHYNCDGIGKDGTQFRAWTTGVQERAIATGHRWVMVEMPRRPDRARPVRGTDIRNGFRPFLVEYSPLAVPMWEATDGQLDWMVIRPRVRKAGPLWAPDNLEDGYYLLVRQGYAGLGDEFAGGGWWLFHGDKTPVENAQGDWSRTRGQIPVVPLVAESSQGTSDWPAMSGSLTMELGQIAVSLMNRISERNWDARDAAKSVKYILGAEKDAHNLMIEHHEANSIIVPVPGSATPDGKWLIPTIYDGSTGAVAAEVFSTIINSTLAEAHEVMVRQLTSEPDSSGRSKEVGFGEATSPLLASLAARRETFENTLIYFTELRAGSLSPSGFVIWPTEFELAPVVAKIDQTIERMLKLGARSATLETSLIEAAARDDGVWPDNAENDIRDELTRSIGGAIVATNAPAMQQMTAAGASTEGAAEVLGLSPEDVTTLVGGGVNGSPDASLPEAGAVVSGADGAENEGTADVEGSAAPNGAIPTGNPANRPSPSQPAPRGVQDGAFGGAIRFNRDETSREIGPGIPDRDGDRAFRSVEDVPSAPTPAPTVDLSPVTDKLDALTAMIQSLVAAMRSQQQPAPEPAPQQAPIVLPIQVAQPATAGKSVTVTDPEGRRWSVDVSANGTQPPPNE